LAQTPSSPQSQQTTPTASIEGSVVRSGSTDGISRAKVTLTPSQSSAAGQAMIVDGDGKFAFRNLPAGQYRLSAAKDGYVSAEYGQRGPNGSGTPITLTAQQHATDIRIGMTSTGAIGGRIVNRYGEPVGNANVQALRYTYQDGKRVLNTVQTARTNDRGEYRLFWMTPGQYIVSAQPTEPISVDSGGMIFFQGPRGGGGPGGLLGPNGPQLGVGGVTRITIDGGPGAFSGPAGPGGAPPPPPPPPPVPVDSPETYLTVYFPGTTDVGSATPIDLRAGGNIDGVNLTVVDVKPVRIRGQVLSGGRPAAGAQVSFYPRSNPNGNLTVRGATASDTGAFEFRNVAPGSYEIAATVNAAGPGVVLLGTPLGAAARVATGEVVGGRGGRNPGQPVMGVRVPVDVNSADIDGLSLVLENGYNIAGRVTIEGITSNDALSALTGMRIQLQSDPLIPPLAIAPSFPDADGTFSITGVTAGTYRLSVSGLPRNMYVKTARFAGDDVYNSGLRIEGDPRGQLEIVLGATPGSLDAVTLDEKQMPESGVTVALVPDPSQSKRIDMYRNATSDASGKIHWDGIIPGDYRIYAWEDIESGAWADPEFMHNFDGRGTSVHIDERGRATVNVKVIPYKAN
jgi:Carboxypeptidase regulatory-like domain